MFLHSSMHIFTTTPKNVVKCFAGECSTPAKQQAEIRNYFEKISHLREEYFSVGLNEEKCHKREFLYAKDYFETYPEDMPAFVVQCDFQKRGISLNILGDILIAPHVVSVLSSRMFCCTGQISNPAHFYLIRSASTRFRRKAILYSLSCNRADGPECRVYFADGKQISCIKRGGIQGKNEELAPELLPAMWPKVDWASVMAESDIMLFSDRIRDAFQLQLDENLSNWNYLRTEGLYNIYQKG